MTPPSSTRFIRATPSPTTIVTARAYCSPCFRRCPWSVTTPELWLTGSGGKFASCTVIRPSTIDSCTERELPSEPRSGTTNSDSWQPLQEQLGTPTTTITLTVATILCLVLKRVTGKAIPVRTTFFQLIASKTKELAGWNIWRPSFFQLLLHFQIWRKRRKKTSIN